LALQVSIAVFAMVMAIEETQVLVVEQLRGRCRGQGGGKDTAERGNVDRNIYSSLIAAIVMRPGEYSEIFGVEETPKGGALAPSSWLRNG